MIERVETPDSVPQKPRRRRIDGVLLLDKPLGISSQAAVTRAKLLLEAAKAGHTGTLDPMASGLLPICFGEATKFAQMLLDSDKTYLATVRLGVTTSTGDLEGEVTARAAVHVTREDIDRVLPLFRGNIAQTPPMYSALKHKGRPLYAYARAGEELTRQPRAVTIFSLDVLEFGPEELTIAVRCSKGTYIRVLAEDIGQELGCGACLAALRRTVVGKFRLEPWGVSIGQLQRQALAQREAQLLPVDALVASLPRLDFGPEQTRLIQSGREVEWPVALAAGLARAYGPGQDFIGVVEIQVSGRIVVRRLLAQKPVVEAPELLQRNGS